MVDGERLTDRYVLEGKIASGGMGGVFTARDETLDRRVAIKVLKEGLADDPRFVERFRREARAAGALSHPNVATVYDYGEENGRHFIVMELVEGRDLARVLREEGPLESDRVAAIGAGVARALEHAHAAGVVHRDIKPANVMLSPGDRVKVTDFGIARAAGESTLTATGSVMGTAQYISPEQASGEAVTPASDIYSLGIVLFEMVTGSVPFTGDNALAVAMKHVNDEVPSARDLKPHTPPVIEEIVSKATKKGPAERYGDASEMARELEEAAITLEAGTDTAVLTQEEHEQTIWPIPGTRYDPERLGKRVIGALAVLAGIALILLVWRIVTADPPEPRRRGQGAAATANGAGGQSPVEETTPETETPSPTPTPPVDGFILENYQGRDVKEVEEILKGAGLHVALEEVDDVSPKGTIVSQSPGEGSEVAEGDTVTLIASSGKVTGSDSEGDDGSEEKPEEKSDKGKAKGHDKEKGED